MQAYKFDILKKTQEQENSKLKEKTQGFNKIDIQQEKMNMLLPKNTISPINPGQFHKKTMLSALNSRFWLKNPINSLKFSAL